MNRCLHKLIALIVFVGARFSAVTREKKKASYVSLNQPRVKSRNL